ncbi:hypothetical protein H6G41_27980 [Tolypothrix sp. FACHB-123]|uniref:WD40 repeat domain-containing protein n=1 Tax=Tolypothrix sp. FACHB-123 TaxID=2692868 RepID=UPI001688C966|nr:WD40 repeat domain-containing protein [Tolypothrix sp. FACHB-123]MBD2358404.1 hypothetical protein [Tolypothrix sp. FACHB-123]
MVQTNIEFQNFLQGLFKYIIEQNPEAIHYIQEIIYEGKYGRRLPGNNGKIPAHDGNVNDVRVSQDGSMIASASVDQTVKVWRKQEDDIFLPTSWAIIENLNIKHNSPVWSVSFSYDGKLIASGDADGIIKIKSINDNSVDIEIQPKLDDEEKQEQIVLKLMFSPDGKSIASANWDNRVRVWRLLDNNQYDPDPIEIGDHQSKVYGVCFSYDGSYIASGGGDNKIKIWKVADTNLTNQEPYQSLEYQSENFADAANAVFDVKFSVDNQKIIAAYQDKSVRIWEIETPQVLQTCQHQDPVYGVSFSADSTKLASGSKDGFVRIWKTNDYNNSTAKPIAEFWHGMQINSVSFSHDSKFIASGSDDKNVRIWDTKHIGESREELVKRLSEDAYNYLMNIDGLKVLDMLTSVFSVSMNQPNTFTSLLSSWFNK